MSDISKLLDKKQLFLKGLENLSEFRSIMAYSDDPEMKEMQQIFDQGFTQLRDQFQQVMNEKASQVTAQPIKRLKKS